METSATHPGTWSEAGQAEAGGGGVSQEVGLEVPGDLKGPAEAL